MNFSDTQKQEFAVSLAALALWDGEAEISSSQIQTLLDATNNTVESYYPIIFASFLTPAVISKLVLDPAAAKNNGPAGGGDAAGAVEEVKVVEKEKVEEEEVDMGGSMDMFGGDAGGGDY